MCVDDGDPEQLSAAHPRPAPGSAVDPVALAPVDEVVITTLVDNVYDALLVSDERAGRAGFAVGTAHAPQFEAGSTTVGLRAEHGFSALEAAPIGQGARRGRRSHR